jgi:hypothetical protein
MVKNLEDQKIFINLTYGVQIKGLIYDFEHISSIDATAIQTI